MWHGRPNQVWPLSIQPSWIDGQWKCGFFLKTFFILIPSVLSAVQFFWLHPEAEVRHFRRWIRGSYFIASTNWKSLVVIKIDKTSEAALLIRFIIIDLYNRLHRNDGDKTFPVERRRVLRWLSFPRDRGLVFIYFSWCWPSSLYISMLCLYNCLLH